MGNGTLPAQAVFRDSRSADVGPRRPRVANKLPVHKCHQRRAAITHPAVSSLSSRTHCPSKAACAAASAGTPRFSVREIHRRGGHAVTAQRDENAHDTATLSDRAIFTGYRAGYIGAIEDRCIPVPHADRVRSAARPDVCRIRYLPNDGANAGKHRFNRLERRTRKMFGRERLDPDHAAISDVRSTSFFRWPPSG